MAEILERPLTVAEAAAKSGRHANTILRWIYSGQLKTAERSPLSPRGKRIHPSDLREACAAKRVPFKQPRVPHLLKKREKDRERWRTKYAGTARIRKYKREYMRWYSKTPHNKAWRKAYNKRRRLQKKAS